MTSPRTMLVVGAFVVLGACTSSGEGNAGTGTTAAPPAGVSTTVAAASPPADPNACPFTTAEIQALVPEPIATEVHSNTGAGMCDWFSDSDHAGIQLTVGDGSCAQRRSTIAYVGTPGEPAAMPGVPDAVQLSRTLYGTAPDGTCFDVYANLHETETHGVTGDQTEMTIGAFITSLHGG